MEPFEIMVSESQERMLAVVEPGEVDEVLALCERWETGAAVDRRGHRRRRTSASCATARLVGEMPVAALVDECPLYDLEPDRARMRLDLRRTGARVALDVGRGPIPTPRSTRRPARLAEHRQQALGVRAVRLDRRLATPSAGPETADAAVLHLPEAGSDDRGLDRRQRASRRVRPLRGHGRGGARVRAEPRLRRRRAARAHQLPQLRQSREADRRLAARPLDAGARRRLRRRSACRSSAATSRSTTRPRTARSTRRRWSAWSASCPTRARRRGSRSRQATRSPSAARSRPRSRARSWRSCAASSGRACPRCRSPTVAGGNRVRPRGRPRRRADRRPRHQRRRPRRARSPRWRSPAASGSTADLDELVELRGCSGETALFGEGPGGFVLAGRRDALERLAASTDRRRRR